MEPFNTHRTKILKEKAKKIKLLILDVDGVLTKGQVILTEHGEEIKSFHVRDGLGIRLLINAGIEVVIITGRKSKAVEFRAKSLGIKEIHQGIRDKEPLCVSVIKDKKLKKDQVCCMGDDLPDIPMFKHSGLPIAVADAADEVKKSAYYITNIKGGVGAVREVLELILKAQGVWDKIISNYL